MQYNFIHLHETPIFKWTKLELLTRWMKSYIIEKSDLSEIIEINLVPEWLNHSILFSSPTPKQFFKKFIQTVHPNKELQPNFIQDQIK